MKFARRTRATSPGLKLRKRLREGTVNLGAAKPADTDEATAAKVREAVRKAGGGHRWN